MAIIRLRSFELIPYKIKLTSPWQSASSTIQFRQGILVKLIDQHSYSAIGECAPIEEMGTESLALATQILRQKLAPLIDQPLTEMSWENMQAYPAARFALESAYLSLLAQNNHISLMQCLANVDNKNMQGMYSPANKIKVNVMLGKLNAQSLTLAKQAEAHGFTCLKFKMGLASINKETQVLLKLLKQVSPTSLIRLDANKSWSISETEQLLHLLKPYSHQIDSIEEPLKNYSLHDYQTLQQQTTIPLALDESFNGQLKHYPLKRLVLKPMVQGGLVKTLMLARQAQEAKIESVITSTIETAHGLWPISQLCAVLNNQQYHGLATASWLEDTLIAPPEIEHGHITL